MKRLLLAMAMIAGLAIPLWTACPVQAQDDAKLSDAERLAKAKRLFRAGARAFQAGKLTFAIQAFDQAYDLAPRPALRFSCAQALRKQYALDNDRARLDQAKRYYQQYLDEVPEGGRRADAAVGLADIDAILAKLAPTAPRPSQGGGGDGGGGEGGGRAAPVVEPAPTAPPKPAVGQLQIETEIAGSRGSVDGHVELTELPLYLELPPGTYRVRVQAPGYKPMVRTVAVAAAELELVAPELDEMPGVVTIAGDDGADIVIDGRLIGRTPMTSALELPSGNHSIAVGASGREPMVRIVDIGKGETMALDADLSLTTQRIIAWSMFAGGGLATTAGIVLSVMAASRQRSAVDIKDSAGDERALTVTEARAFNQHVESRDNLVRFATGAYALGALAGGVGLLLYILDDPDLYTATAKEMKQRQEQSESPELDLEAAPLEQGAMLIINGRF